jgi:hypothetical protein
MLFRGVTDVYSEDCTNHITLLLKKSRIIKGDSYTLAAVL